MKSNCLIFAALFLSAFGFGQEITGNWEGNLNVQGSEIPIVFHISKDSSGKLTATFDSPKQKAFNLTCNQVAINGDSVILYMNIIKGKYAATLQAGNKQMNGSWFQGPGSLPLNVTKTSDIVSTRMVKRPQTPKAPYPYLSENVAYNNTNKNIRFGATFTAPIPDPNTQYAKTPVYPTVILITGSGKQDRDETIFDHKPFAVIADYLTRHGIAVLRVDDRDMGSTTGDFNTATTADFAKDVEAGIAYLKTRKEVDTTHMGLIGHSEGGIIAPMLASSRKDIKFIVMLAGPGVKITELMEQQAVDVLAKSDLPSTALDKYRILYRNMVTTILHSKDNTIAMKESAKVFTAWQKGLDSTMLLNITGVSDQKSMNEFIRGFVMQLHSPWFNYFMRINPASYLSKVQCPVLALNGEKDIQVAATPNLAAIKNALKNNSSKKVVIREMKDLNHLFQHCKTCSVPEYDELEESFSPEVLEIIANWINSTVK